MGFFDSFSKALGWRPQERTVEEQRFYGFAVDVEGRGLTPDYFGWRNAYWGQPQPASYRLLWKAFTEDEVVAAAVKTTADRILADGWELLGDENKVGELLKFLKKNHFNSVLRDTILQLLLYGDAYIELIRGDVDSPNGLQGLKKAVADLNNKRSTISYEVNFSKNAISFDDSTMQSWGFDWEEYPVDERQEIKSVFVDGNAWTGTLDGARELFATELSKPGGRVFSLRARDSASIRIDYDHNGRVFRYIQRVLQRRVDYYPDEIVHFSINNIGGRLYGTSPLLPLMRKLLMRASAEKYNEDWFKRSGMPRTIYFFEDYLSKEQEARYEKTIKSAGYHNDIVLSGKKPNVIQVAPSNAEMQFVELLKYLREQILIGLQVPPSLVGLQIAGQRTAQNEFESYDLHIKSLKKMIADLLNEYLFTEANFGGPDVEFRFTEDNTRELFKRTQAAQMAAMVRSSSGVQLLSDEQLMDIMGLDLDEEHIEEAREEQQTRLQQFGGGFLPKRDKIWDNPRQVAQSNVEHEERAREQNVEQQMEHKSVDYVEGAFSSRLPGRADLRYDSTYGAKPMVDLKELASRVREWENWTNYIKDVLAYYGFYGLNDEAVNPQTVVRKPRGKPERKPLKNKRGVKTNHATT